MKTKIEESLERLVEIVFKLKNVNGVNIQEKDGNKIFVVFTVYELSKADMSFIPKTFEGINVEVETIGEIKLQNN